MVARVGNTAFGTGAERSITDVKACSTGAAAQETTQGVCRVAGVARLVAHTGYVTPMHQSCPRNVPVIGRPKGDFLVQLSTLNTAERSQPNRCEGKEKKKHNKT